MTIRARLFLLTTLLLLAIAVVAGVAATTLGQVKVNGPLYQGIVLGKDLVADVLPPPEYVIETQLLLLQAAREPDPARRARLAERVAVLEREFEARNAFWRSALAEGPLRQALVEDSAAPARALFLLARQELLPALARGDAAAVAHGLAAAEGRYAQHRAAIDRVVELANARTAADEAEGQRVVSAASTQLAVIVVVCLAAALVAGFSVSRGISRNLALLKEESLKLTAAAAEGALDVSSDTSRLSPEFRPILEGMNTTVAAVRALAEDVEGLSGRAQAGDLSARADAGRHHGQFRTIVVGVNGTLEAVAAPLAEASGVLSRLAERDLRARMEGRYAGDLERMKADLNATASSLEEAMASIEQSAGQVSVAANEIATSSQAVADGAQRQASAVSQSSAGLEVMTDRTRITAGQAAEASALTTQARAAASGGTAAVEEVTAAMTRIQASAAATSQIIRDINDIALQTNLLALNAAVEAARAGRAGQAFSVVADEVRSLAARAKEAARKTEELIAQSVRQAEHGAQVAAKAAAEFRNVDQAVGRAAALVGEISASMQEHTVGIDQLNRAVSEMNQVTQQNAASSEQSSASAAELSRQASTLAETVATFQLLGAEVAAPGGPLAAWAPAQRG